MFRIVFACFIILIGTACAVRPAAPQPAPAPAQLAQTPTLTPSTITMSPTEAQQQLDPMWKALKKPVAATPDVPGILWDKAVTPPLPMNWPPVPGMDWVRYVYAHGRDVQLADGVRLAKPWARITLHADGTATLTQLAPTLEESGVQGVVPLGQEQQSILQTGEAAQATAMGLTTLPDTGSPQAREVKAYYSAWVKFNGVIASLVSTNHAPFFTWLEQ